MSFDKICHKFLVSHIEICLLSISHFVCKYNIVYFIKTIKTIFAIMNSDYLSSLSDQAYWVSSLLATRPGRAIPPLGVLGIYGPPENELFIIILVIIKLKNKILPIPKTSNTSGTFLSMILTMSRVSGGVRGCHKMSPVSLVHVTGPCQPARVSLRSRGVSLN